MTFKNVMKENGFFMRYKKNYTKPRVFVEMFSI